MKTTKIQDLINKKYEGKNHRQDREWDIYLVIQKGEFVKEDKQHIKNAKVTRLSNSAKRRLLDHFKNKLFEMSHKIVTLHESHYCSETLAAHLKDFEPICFKFMNDRNDVDFVLTCETKEELLKEVEGLKRREDERKVHPEGTTWEDVLKMAGLENNKMAKKVVEDLADPRECDANWLKDSFHALADNINRGGQFGKSWENGELETHRALGLCLQAWRRHNETNYDDLVKRYGKDISRDAIR